MDALEFKTANTSLVITPKNFCYLKACSKDVNMHKQILGNNQL